MHTCIIVLTWCIRFPHPLLSLSLSPSVSPLTLLISFFPSLCLRPSLPSPFRSVYLTFENALLHGPTLYRYVLPAVELRNTSQDPGFFPNGPSGVLNLTAVLPNSSPVFGSKPHFLDADPGYIANVSGMHPNRSVHDSYWDVEPTTGEWNVKLEGVEPL